MHPKSKAYLIFSIVYWLLILAGLILFGLSFEPVHLNKYALRRNYYNSHIDSEQYISGIYHKGLGYYFLEFPSSKRYLYQSLNITNADMKKVGVHYTLIYRIRPDHLYDLYQEMAMSYESRILAYVNSILSNHFGTLAMADTRVTAQSAIVTQVNQFFARKNSVLTKAVQIQALWIDQLDFYQEQRNYEKAYVDSSSYSEAYQGIEIELMKTSMRVESLKNVISSLQERVQWEVEKARKDQYISITSQASSVPLQSKSFLSALVNISQIFEYYPGVTLTFQ